MPIRPVAIALVALMWAAALPSGVAATPYDDCAGGPAGANPCVTISVPRETPDDRAIPPPAGGLTYYLWAAAAKCAPTFDGFCSGRPAGGNPALGGVVGVLYEETNGGPGLQRFSRFVGTTLPPDAMILV